MKNRANQILLAAALAAAALYAFVMLCWVGAVPVRDPELWMTLGFFFHAVPCFFLQLLVCRTAKRPLPRLIPVLLLLAAAALLAAGLYNASGLDILGWGVLLLLCIAPAAGYGLAWSVYGVQYLIRQWKGASI